MKVVFKNSVRNVLRSLAKRKLKRINPKVIGITGSVGKTSAKEAISSVLERNFKVVKSEKNYNTDFGAILTILGYSTGYSSLGRWFWILLRAGLDSLKKPEPFDALVMEMGVDKPGDMQEILSVITPDIMVFLNVKDVHRGEGQFPNKEAIFEEKSRASAATKSDGWVILNVDDTYVRQLADKLPASTLKIGLSGESDIRATHVETTPHGLSFVLNYENKEIPVKLPRILGDCHVTIVLAAIAVGFVSGMNWKEIEAGLHEFSLPPGRMNKIEGVNSSLIVDSSYNASPDAVEEALKVLSIFQGRRIAALGTMNELGELSESAHIKIGKEAALSADVLVAVGSHAKDMAEGAHRAGMSASMIHQFRNSKDAGQFLSGFLERGDTLLVKGSQNRVRMEHVVKMCMAYPEDARQLLVRQEPYWLTKL
ncbi:UDP-N-acetylmuramoyl-tripeptide--D-alanyl-D-alanine ligase [Patescibacteria group bacterium]|nr:UDP-N-acetylmuramoyl-tripeptide--D-alanyl-D-alanine ligase [Patescibacteria group bacterium]